MAISLCKLSLFSFESIGKRSISDHQIHRYHRKFLFLPIWMMRRARSFLVVGPRSHPCDWNDPCLHPITFSRFCRLSSSWRSVSYHATNSQFCCEEVNRSEAFHRSRQSVSNIGYWLKKMPSVKKISFLPWPSECWDFSEEFFFDRCSLVGKQHQKPYRSWNVISTPKFAMKSIATDSDCHRTNA